MEPWLSLERPSSSSLRRPKKCQESLRTDGARAFGWAVMFDLENTLSACRQECSESRLSEGIRRTPDGLQITSTASEARQNNQYPTKHQRARRHFRGSTARTRGRIGHSCPRTNLRTEASGHGRYTRQTWRRTVQLQDALDAER